MATNEELKLLIAEMKNSMVTEDKFDELFKLLGEYDDKIAQLEDRVKVLETQAGLYERRLDDLESYGRRQNLRIVGIPPPSNGRKESAEEVLEKVKDAIAELDVPNLNVDEVIDRAHRVGKKFKRDGSNEEIHPIIVRFTSWRSRTAVYRKREKRGRTRFYTDLTKRRLDLKKLADAKTKDNEKVKFAFADVNNNIGLRLADDRMVYFNSVDELERTLASL